MNSSQMQLTFLLRILMAMFCGGIIGIERQNRSKIAGIRTHLMVALAACLMMIISKYGFGDVITIDGISCDASRIASSIVTGIGFIGTGLIFTGKQGHVSGMTTAAGVWVTVGIGMAIGAGMFFIGLTTSVIVVLCQWILHRDISLLKESAKGQIELLLPDTCSPNAELALAEEIFIKNSIKIDRIHFDQKSKGDCHLKFYITVPRQYCRDDLIQIFQKLNYLSSFEI